MKSRAQYSARSSILACDDKKMNHRSGTDVFSLGSSHPCESKFARGEFPRAAGMGHAGIRHSLLIATHMSCLLISPR